MKRLELAITFITEEKGYDLLNLEMISFNPVFEAVLFK